MIRDMAPQLEYVPHFVQLRPLKRATVATYGAIAAFQARGHHPTVREIAYAARIARSGAEEALRVLVKSGWVRRANVGAPKSRVRYELLGPTLHAKANAPTA